MQEDKLSAVLSEFAHTLITDFPIQGILDRLVERIVGVLNVTAAGVTLISPGMAPHYVAASNQDALEFEKLQSSLGQGPCLTAYSTGEPVSVPDLVSDDRYPLFGPAAVAAGMAAVFTFPLRHGNAPLGALDLYRNTAGALDPADMAAAQTLADVAAAYLLNAQVRQEAQDLSDRFRDSAMRDALTGLPNRLLLQQRIQHAAERAQRSHGAAAVLFADLDRFKRVNDVHGHAVGDALLIAVARRLSALLRPGDTLARVSGDEFVILCEDLAHADDVDRLASRIHASLSEPFEVSGASMTISASVGVAYAGPGEAVTIEMVADADIAMYQAKHSGGAIHQVIDLRAATVARERIQLEIDLHAAVSTPQLDVAYQPIVQTADGLVVGVEALLRWTHPEQGPVSALTAVSIAEQSGLIGKVGGWVLERACRDRMQWLTDYPHRALDLSVNVSGRQLMGAGFTETVTQALESSRMDPAALTLEVTEGVFIDDSPRVMSVLGDLKDLGVRLALDDFGTGYCSLTYLQRFPVDMVKIDRSFVTDMGYNDARAAIAAAVTSLSHTLGLGVTAEGVETEQQRLGIVDIGCELAQGYLYARPMSVVELHGHMAADKHTPLRLPNPAVDAQAVLSGRPG